MVWNQSPIRPRPDFHFESSKASCRPVGARRLTRIEKPPCVAGLNQDNLAEIHNESLAANNFVRFAGRAGLNQVELRKRASAKRLIVFGDFKVHIDGKCLARLEANVLKSCVAGELISIRWPRESDIWL